MFYTVPLFVFSYGVGTKSIGKGAFTGSHCVLESNHCITMCFADKWTTKVLFLLLLSLSPTMITE
jgi:hypothetical protein